MGDKFILSNKNNVNNITSDEKSSSKKSKRSMNIIKMALYMLKKNKVTSSKPKKSKSSPHLSNATNVTISRLVGSVRPLHLQDGVVNGQSPPLPPQYSSKYSLPKNMSSPELDEVVAGMSPLMYEPSPLHSSSSYCSFSQASCSSPSIEGMSGYNSAYSLFDLDEHADEEISCDTPCSDIYYDGIEGDEMIDSKADLFIAKMYQQMRLE